MSIVLILFLLPAVLYAAVWRLSLRGRRPKLAGTLLAAALTLHAGSLILPWQPGSFHYGFAKLLSATVWIGVLLVWVESSRVEISRLASLLAPLAIVLVMLPHFFPGVAFDLRAQPPLFVPHLIVGTLAYGVMFLAALQALLMAAASYRLHPRRPAERPGLLTSLLVRGSTPLPPLMVLERILFRVIAIGFALLLMTTLTGVVFSEETFGKPLPLNHKTVFSLVATVFVGLLLAGHWLWGWRGRIAIRLTFGGFVLLLLSYVGSRFVLEVVLRRF
ncbi:MAG: cytochrome c biogenesis protein CcsA [Lautropia sp.]|nr:cytochrome c biogenesis protein CcsA [Lautropia sp.]